jgi:antitoxin (DNA-binding transcriptional repressor) of toxin-antitoxin stability system
MPPASGRCTSRSVARNAHYNQKIDMSVTEFRAHGLELIRQVEAGGEALDIKRHDRLVARLSPPNSSSNDSPRP